MKKLSTILGTLVLVTLFTLPTYARGHGMSGGGGMMGGGSGMGTYGGQGGGSGMGMHGGQDGGSQYGPQNSPQNEHQYRDQQGPMYKIDAEKMMEGYIRSTRNPNLKLGKIEDKGNFFECEILTKDGSLVDKVAIDKERRSMRSIY